MRTAQAISAAMVLTLAAGCGTIIYEHEVRITLLDPSGRLGGAPVDAWAFEVHEGYSGSAEYASKHLEPVAPGRDAPQKIRDSGVVWMWEFRKVPEVVELGIYVPKLRSGGWWKLDVRPTPGTTWRGEARYCAWGNLFPDADAERLTASVDAKRGARHWDLHVTLNVPAEEPEPPEPPVAASPTASVPRAGGTRRPTSRVSRTAAEPEAADAPHRVGGPIIAPRRISHVAPVLPPSLPEDVPAVVIVEHTIGRDGRVTDARVLRGHPAVDAAVIAAVRRWRYEPTLLNGAPIAIVHTAVVSAR